MKTKRTYLRQFHSSDLEDLFEMMSDPEIMKHTGFREPQSKNSVAEKLLKWTQSKKVWAAIETDSEALIGWFMLKRTILDAPELGFMLIKSKWNQGFASEISKCILDYAFYQLGEEKVVASVDEENLASVKVLKKLGFVETKSYSGDKGICYFEILK
ncbi:MAG: RimJ/RimL family protein N-acetyltransferase [Bacteriovoracaceae bacterium]|jgi:RimJ/RimL family protein N-acetyltransferase